MTVLYETPIIRIGKHDWKLQVYQHPIYGNCTRYLWQRMITRDPKVWIAECEWPTYDGNETHGGLPRTLAKLYARYKQEIENALDETNQLEAPQRTELF